MKVIQSCRCRLRKRKSKYSQMHVGLISTILESADYAGLEDAEMCRITDRHPHVMDEFRVLCRREVTQMIIATTLREDDPGNR